MSFGISLPAWNKAVESINPETHASFANLPWYPWWVRRQIRDQPPRLRLALPNGGCASGWDWDTHLLPLWNKVQELILVSGLRTIDDIVNALIDIDLISANGSYEAMQSAKDIVFSILGWQTMLYKPNFLDGPSGDFTIVDEMQGHHGDSHVRSSQISLASKRDLPNFLLGFGMMLPPRDYCAFGDTDDEKQLFHKTKAIMAKNLNAHVLSKVCGLSLKWVDSVSCHLELDKISGTLFLFRYPSFCISNLQARESREWHRMSSIYGCAVEAFGHVPWANEEDITELLQEILLSYRLLFGQSRRSRSLFRRLRPFARVPQEEHDRVLSLICGKKRFRSSITMTEREEYVLASDFPHLRSRMVRLNTYATSKKPHSIRQLWRDKRDSTAWLAFWSVLVFGSMSIVLGVIQTVLQIMQYVLTLQQAKTSSDRMSSRDGT
ncbi:hypothetical protein JDV02_005032 [Purpureocillium takamizusanense]|uniref:Uncharacterized protein n=1 Tax=Purpureocillium takamizusanense TaxID=2060973 RepID=A0A9Q8VBG3_9HYPO|nr:uncharacterized protein JDV02_005032 [Purpureocillium takamizusanense]UNI18782.1 hypothetical protein JDV02_005032 [Purpureocillium takamizusanense]